MFKCKFVTIFQLNSVTQRKFCLKKFRLFHNVKLYLGFPGGSVKESACDAEDLGLIPGSERFSEEGNGNYSSILPWEIPWTEEPGALQSMESQESDTT